MELNSVELVMEVENRFGIRIKDVEATGVRTVGDLYRVVLGKVGRIVVVGFFLLVGQGCCNYRDASRDSQFPAVLWHRCILSKPASFPEGGNHWLPSINPPYTPSRYPPVELEQGTILRVAYVEAWNGPLVPSGTAVYADIENGPKRGHRVVIGYFAYERASKPSHVLYVGPPTMGVRPLNLEDSGIFYTGNFSRTAGFATELVPLQWSPGS